MWNDLMICVIQKMEKIGIWLLKMRNFLLGFHKAIAFNDKISSAQKMDFRSV